jgi:NAD(P)-dependent dehydrogenase (short-subunit alcohol dehydrogenase family)
MDRAMDGAGLTRFTAAMLELRDAVAVVTGTSSGLGRQLALDLADAGATVIGLARRADRQEDLSRQLTARQPGSAARVADVADVAAFTAVLAGIEAEHGRLDLLVNNAAEFEPDEGLTVDSVRRVFETNVFAAVAATLTVLPGMEARGRGAVVNVSSDVARAPVPDETAYGASKAALSAFTESLSYRAARSGVSLHVLYPGFIPRGDYQVPGGVGGLGQRLTTRTDAQVSAQVLAAVRHGRLEIDAAFLPRLAPVVKALAPRAYRRMVPAASPDGDH